MYIFFVLITSYYINGSNNNLDSTNNETIELNSSKSSTKVNIPVFLNKLKKKTILIDKDYQDISVFLLKNKNESMSEEVGYLLFNFFKGNKVANNEYLSFLKKKDKAFKEHILSDLIQIMCIDLEDEKYTYKKLINDFGIFRGSVAAQRSFKQCIDNQAN